MDIFTGIVLVAYLIPLCKAGEYCWTDSGSEYCDSGCCADRGSRFSECCSSLSAWVIVVILLAVVLFIVIIVLVVYCIKKSKQKPHTRVSAVQFGAAVNYQARGSHRQNRRWNQQAPYPVQPPGVVPTAPPLYSVGTTAHTAPPPYRGDSQPPGAIPSAPLPSYRQLPRQGMSMDYGQFPQVSNDNQLLPTKS